MTKIANMSTSVMAALERAQLVELIVKDTESSKGLSLNSPVAAAAAALRKQDSPA